MFDRASFLTHHALIAIAVAVFPLSSCFAQTNIVLIMADDVGCDPIGAYGGERWKTPQIDRLASEGVLFRHCYSMPVCHPTRLCLMTGKYPFRFDANWGSFPKAEEEHSLAAVLKRCGYRTAIAGKWQLCLLNDDRMQPKRMGFDEWCLFGWHEGARYHDPWIYETGKLRSNTAGRYGPDEYVDFLCKFMEKCKKEEQPFFAYYSMALAHDVTNDLATQVPYVPGKNRWMNYGEMIESMDEMVGRVVRSIDDLGLRENTVILFTGDNGTAVRSKLRHRPKSGYEFEKVYSIRNGKRVPGGKGSLLDIGTNVPLIARWPGTIEPASHNNALVDFSDWLPTLVEIAGGHVERELDGRSFAGLLLDSTSEPLRQFAFSQGRKGGAWVRTQRYKLYHSGRFFDVSKDPSEKNDLADDKGAVATLRRRLEKEMDDLGFPAVKD